MKAQVAKPMLRAVLLACLLGPLAAWAAATDHYWHETANRSLPAQAPQPAQFRSLSLDSEQMLQHLKAAQASGQPGLVSLPLPEGGFTDFSVIDSGTMSPGLQARLKQEFDFDVLSLKGRDAEGRRVRLDVSPIGFQAMVFDPDGIWVIRPETLGGGTNQYLSFRRNQLSMPDDFQYIEDEIEDLHEHGAMPQGPLAPMTEVGAVMRTYRAAVAANSFYIAAVGGGSAAGGQAAVVTAMNRVNEVYNYELSVQLELVPNNINLMFPNAGSDPFAANNSGILGIITGKINGIIGSDNYDIGHAFTTGSGGVAGLGVVCGSQKGRGTTGLGSPIGDVFYIDYVSHEMGHQFGGNHPFNGTNGSCGGNRSAAAAYEPGSGSTIQGYAGICGADNLQNNSDPYFHAISLQEINAFINGGGNSCAQRSNNPNQMPSIDLGDLPPSGSLTIPARTPFLLSASASDPDAGDALWFGWEQWDRGPTGAPLSAGDSGSNPILRSWPPSRSGTRSFPSMSTVLGGTAIKGETLPTTTRALNFRLTVRDRDDSLHGMGRSQSADYKIQVSNGAGPFKVNTPLASDTWYGGAPGTVTWDVANTDVPPVNCTSVDVLVSLDGGDNFDHVAAQGIPNTGSASVTAPNVAAVTGTARVAVMCSNNLFFNVTQADFTIVPGSDLYHVGGEVTGLTGSGLELQLNGGSTLAVAANGPFVFNAQLPDGATYVVTVVTQPSLPNQECTVSNGSGSINGADVDGISVDCNAIATGPFTIGGTVTGLTVPGLLLELNGRQLKTIDSDGAQVYFSPGLDSGEAYEVKALVTPPGLVCSIAGASGTMGFENVTNVDVSCTAAPELPDAIFADGFGDN